MIKIKNTKLRLKYRYFLEISLISYLVTGNFVSFVVFIFGFHSGVNKVGVRNGNFFGCLLCLEAVFGLNFGFVGFLSRSSQLGGSHLALERRSVGSLLSRFLGFLFSSLSSSGLLWRNSKYILYREIFNSHTVGMNSWILLSLHNFEEDISNKTLVTKCHQRDP